MASTEAPERRGNDDTGLVAAARAVRRQWIALVVTFVVLAVGGGAYVALLPVQYQATAVISFVPSAGDSSGRDLVALLAARYPEIVASTDSLTQAATASGMTESEVQAGLSAAIQPGSLNLVLTVKAPTQEEAKAAVASLYQTTLKANEGDTNIRAVAVSAPSASSSPAGVPKKILYAAVLLLAAMVAVVVALIVDQFRAEDND